MRLSFTTSSTFIEDGNFRDFAIGDRFSSDFNLSIQTNIKPINETETKLINIKYNLYEVICCVVHLGDYITFVEIENLVFMIDDEYKSELEIGNYYSFQAYIYHDIWNRLVLYEYELYTKRNEYELYTKIIDRLYISGIIKSIFIDTQKPEKIATNGYATYQEKAIFDVELQYTSVFEDEITYLHNTAISPDYLVEIEFDKKIYIQNRFLDGLKNLLIKRLRDEKN